MADGLIEALAEIDNMFRVYANGPCSECSMIASLHYQTEEQAAENKFGCEGYGLAACKCSHMDRLRGHPGVSGVDFPGGILRI